MDLEELSKDILDEPFINNLKPIHLLQTALGLNRTEVKNKFVTSRPYSTPIPYLWFAFQLYLAFVCIGESLATPNFDLSMKHTADVFLTVVFIINNVKLFLPRRTNEKMIIHMQKIDRLLRLSSGFYKRQFRRNICFIVPFLTFALLAFLTTSFGLRFRASDIMVHVLASFRFDAEILSCSIYLDFLTERLQYINNKLKTSAENRADLNTYKKYTEDSVDAYDNIVRTFEKIKKCYRFQIFLYSSYAVFNILIIIEMFINSFKFPTRASRAWSLFSMMAVVAHYSGGVIVAAAASQWFLDAAARLRRTSADILAVSDHILEREMVKRILVLGKAYEPQFTVYGIFQLDMSLPFQCLSFLTTYIVVLIQFAFHA